jgi:H+/Cl- antiporter ClcA
MKKYRFEQGPILLFTLKWIAITAIVAVLVGIASAGFLKSLEWAASTRNDNMWLLWLLPVGGFIIGLIYHLYGQDVEGGNNLILDRINLPKGVIPLKMAPLVLFGTIGTHLFGGSAGREGTAVQMGGAIADQFGPLFQLKARDKQLLLISGVAAGFSSVFGTPLAGAIFGLEVFLMGKITYEAILPAFTSAILADYVCQIAGGTNYFNISHTHYHIGNIPEITSTNLLWIVLAGIIFGMAGMTFSKLTKFFGTQFKKHITYPPLRPFVGGVIVVILAYAFGNRYIGLGIPVIESAFLQQEVPSAFILKIIFTAVTLGAGFKGGEVTPLFFVGATLGSALSIFIDLPTGLLAGVGFVAVFSSAANTPLATIFMGIELFAFGHEEGGHSASIYIALGCVIAYLFSGHSGIYSSQIVSSVKNAIFKRDSGKTLGKLKK